MQMKKSFMDKIRCAEDMEPVINQAMNYYINEFNEVVNGSPGVDTPFIVAALTILLECLKQSEYYTENADDIVKNIISNCEAFVIKEN